MPYDRICAVQGGVDEGEDPKSAAIRELREETGVTSAEVLAEVIILQSLSFVLICQRTCRERPTDPINRARCYS